MRAEVEERSAFLHAWSSRLLSLFVCSSGQEHAILESEMGYIDRITIDPNRRSGKPCIRGTRITVYDVLEYPGGMSIEEILGDFLQLTREDTLAVLEFAAERERRLMTVSA